MRCDEARDRLWPPEAPKLADERALEARRHVDGCESCRDYLAQDAVFLDTFRNARRIQAPAEVRERIFDTLAREGIATKQPVQGHGGKQRAAPRLSRPVILALAAAALVVAMVPVLYPLPDSTPRANPAAPPDRGSESAFVEDFLRRAVQAEHIQTSDPAEVARFLSRELGTVARAPLSVPGFELEGAEVCIVAGVRGAVIVYKQNGRVLYRYLIPNAGADKSGPALSGAIPPRWSVQGSLPSVVTWRSGKLEQALVSDIPPDELLDMARALATEA